MNQGNSRLCAYIDMDAAAFNFEMMRRKLKEGTKMCAVVKADGYGHGAEKIALMAQEYPYIWGFAAATVPEAFTLRKAGITKPILILGCIFPEDYETVITNEIRATICDMLSAEELSRTACRLGKDAIIHIAADTGMSRIGFPADEEGACLAAKVSRMNGIRLEGVFTHFAKADEADKSDALNAFEKYVSFLSKLKEKGVRIPICHCSNSAAILELPEAHLDMVRAGISIYGIYPSDEMDRQQSPLKPVMSLKSHITALRTIDRGTSVSYGGLFTAEKETIVATVPVGYADGYPRSLSCKGSVLIHGKRAPILGRVCMDQMMVDVTDIPVQLRDEVTLLGKDGDDEITIYELSELSGRFPYEFVCDVGRRVERVYLPQQGAFS